MPATLVVESAGPGTTVQDGGRFGWLRFGVTPSGPMDWVALRTANLALGNAPAAAALEIGIGGIALRVDRPTALAFAGGGFAWTRDEQSLPPAARIVLRPGERLRARAGTYGSVCYCAVPGGLDVPIVMGSRATHVRSGLGGLDGRALRAGDAVSALGESGTLDDLELTPPWLAPRDAPIRVVLGPQDDHFTATGLATFVGERYTLTPRADRMAYKLDGPTIEHARDFNIVSDGIALGAIQVAGDGRPMVLMADRQPTGGYPKIAHVIRADIGRLAQMRAGEACRFAIVDADAARAALLRAEDRLSDLDRHAAPLRRTPTFDRLVDENLIGGVVDGGADL